MKAYKNILVVGEKNTFVSMTYENMYKPITYMKYNKLPCKGNNMASNVNALAIINKYLGEIYKNKAENNMHYFVVPNNICKAIKAGTYKNWVKTGKTVSGKEIDLIELYQWTIFASLYRELFTEVDFKPLSYYSMKNIKYNVKQMQFTKDLINKAYEYIQNNKDKNLFNTLEDILD
jgi:hypothetical protein